MSKIILFADDDKFQLMSITGILKQLNIDLITCDDGQIAINKYTEKYKEIDLIILDIHMPNKDGFQACKEIKQLQKKFGKNQKIYGISADDDDDILEQALDSGMVSLLKKPLQKSVMSQII